MTITQLQLFWSLLQEKNYADYVADRILDTPQIIAFRNPLIQGFASVIDLAVWRAPLKSLYRIFTKFWQVF